MKWNRSWMGLLWGLTITGVPVAAQEATTRVVAEAMGMDASSRFVVEFCERSGAPNAPGLRASWQAWRIRTDVDELARQLEPEARSALQRGAEELRAKIESRMAREGSPARACAAASTLWGTPEPGPRAGSAPAASVAGVQGIYYTPAQLTALVQGWRAAGDRAARYRAMRAHGPLHLRGKVVRRGEHFFVDEEDDAFRARLAVSPGMNLARFEGRVITLRGELDEFPQSMVFLRRSRVVTDESALRPSPLDAAAGRFRAEVDVARVTAGNGLGIRPDELFGIHHHGRGVTTADGYQFKEEVRLLLKDGTAYFGTRTDPENLDKRKSRELEPQLWGQWRKAASGIELRRQDDLGRLGPWAVAPGTLLSPWPSGRRLNAAYTRESFHGSIALGGTFTRTSLVFGADGRFERIRYSQSGSGSMAQVGSDFSANASSHADGEGSSSLAGGGQGGEGGGSSFVHSSRTSKDGAGNRGRYELGGFGLLLRYDDGRVERLLCAARDAGPDSLVIGNTTWSRRKL